MKEKLPLLLVVLGASVGAASCYTDNPAAYRDILGRSVRPDPDEPGMDAGGTGTGGAGGSTGGGSQTTGGSPMGKGGTGAGGKGTGGGNGSGGSNMGGTGNPPVDPNYSPACFELTTVTGEEILKGAPCTPEDAQLCYRPCGPQQVGWKTETCTAGVYAEGPCIFPDYKDYSCYHIPDPIDPGVCGITAAPAATDECTAPLCTVCNFEGFYQDSSSQLKEGYCVCREPDIDGVRRWTCGSTTAWPCPFSSGC